MSTVLFICKSGAGYTSGYADPRKFSGLANSARLVSEMLENFAVSSVVEVATDNNDIDRLVTLHTPKWCVIEAYWVVPSKFEILTKLHPTVKWVIRIHSELPFWATEGVAMEWTYGYLKYPQVYLAPNSYSLYRDMRALLEYDRLVFLPNYYPVSLYKDAPAKSATDIWNVGCFGAIRPLKNQLIQAVAAIRYADIKDRTLHFHINSGRVEGGGEPVLKNIRNLFANSNRHKLIEHNWIPHEDFVKLVSSLDLGMQVSFSESFNIVAADFVSQGIPVVTSKEIEWIASPFYADCTDTKSIVKAIYLAETLGRKGTFLNKYLLHSFSESAKGMWLSFIDLEIDLEIE